MRRGMEEKFEEKSCPFLKKQIEPLEVYENRKEGQTLEELDLLEGEEKRKACLFVFDFLKGNVCSLFKNYFNFLTHDFNTSNSEPPLFCRKWNVTAWKRFYLLGASAFNSLRLKISFAVSWCLIFIFCTKVGGLKSPQPLPLRGPWVSDLLLFWYSWF